MPVRKLATIIQCGKVRVKEDSIKSLTAIVSHPVLTLIRSYYHYYTDIHCISTLLG